MGAKYDKDYILKNTDCVCVLKVVQQPPPDIKLKNINSNMDGKMKDNCYDIISSAFFCNNRLLGHFIDINELEKAVDHIKRRLSSIYLNIDWSVLIYELGENRIDNNDYYYYGKIESYNIKVYGNKKKINKSDDNTNIKKLQTEKIILKKNKMNQEMKDYCIDIIASAFQNNMDIPIDVVNYTYNESKIVDYIQKRLKEIYPDICWQVMVYREKDGNSNISYDKDLYLHAVLNSFDYKIVVIVSGNMK